MNYTFHKVGGILIKDKKLLVTRSKDKDFFVAPGGKVEKGENVHQALIRELKEELSITVKEAEIEPFDVFYADAAGQKGDTLRMDVFIVTNWRGEIKPDNEIEEIAWVDSSHFEEMNIGSIFAHDVIPELRKQGLIN